MRRVLGLWLGSGEVARSFASMCNASTIPGFSTGHRILKRHAFRIILVEPPFGSFFGGEHSQMILVTDLLACIDINPNGHVQSLICKKSSFTSVSRSLPG